MRHKKTTWTALASLTAGATCMLLLGATPDGGMDDRVAELNQRVKALETQMAGLTQRMSWNHPDAQTEKDAARQLASINAMVTGGKAAQAKPQLDQFMERYANTKAAAQARSLQDSLAAVGKPVPADWGIEHWYQGDAAGLNASGTTVVIFWETWCPHCRRAMPRLQQMYDQYKGRGLNMVGLTKLTRSSTDAQVQEFINQHKIQFSMGKENGRVSTYFGVSGIPDSAVIQNGTVIWSGHPAALNTALIETWLADLSS